MESMQKGAGFVSVGLGSTNEPLSRPSTVLKTVLFRADRVIDVFGWALTRW